MNFTIQNHLETEDRIRSLNIESRSRLNIVNLEAEYDNFRSSSFSWAPLEHNALSMPKRASPQENV